MRIKVKEIIEGSKFEIIEKGDWIDLHAAEDIELVAPQAGVQYELMVSDLEMCRLIVVLYDSDLL